MMEDRGCIRIKRNQCRLSFVSRLRVRAILALLIACVGIGRGLADDTQLHVTVEEAEFTLLIKPDRQPADSIDSIVFGQEPYLWTRLTGNQATLDKLRAKRKLPIYHYWRRFVYDVPVGDVRPEELEKDIPLDLGVAAAADELQSEIDDRRAKSQSPVFDWRTWSKKQSLAPGQWIVFVYYADNTPVTCGDSYGTVVSCSYRLLVKEAP